MREKRPSVGAVQMVEALKAKTWSLNELARRLETSEGLVSRWAKGQRFPRLEWLVKIETLLGVPVARWNEMPRRPRSRKAA